MINVVLSESEQKVIGTLYEHFRKTGEWIGARTLHQKLGRRIIENVISQKESQLIIKSKVSGGRTEYYELTFLGIYLSSKAKDDIELLYRYLNLLKQRFNENPEIQELSSSEVEVHLNLTKEQSRLLRDFINIGHIWGGSASIGEEWKFGIPDDIEDLAEIGDPKEYLEQHIEKEEKRVKKLKKLEGFDKYRLGFWAFLIIILWREFFDIAHHFSRFLPYYVMFTTWFTLYLVAKILEVLRIRVPFFSSEKIIEKTLWWVITIVVSAIGWVVTKFLSK